MSNACRLGLALGGGSARGLAHIVMLEAIEELGLTPARIAGTSFGAIIGGLYATGLKAPEIKGFVEDLLARRSELLRRLAASYDGLASLWSPRAPSVVDGVTLFEILMPARMRTSFESLCIPFSAIAADFQGMREVEITQGPLIPAIAASAALPSLLRPVALAGRVLIDGGFVNPTPFDVLHGRVDRVVAIDVTGATPSLQPGEVPGPVQAWGGATQIMFRAIVSAKLAIAPPDLLIRPDVAAFTTLDFPRFREIFAAAAPAKDDLKRGLERLLTTHEQARRG